MPRLAGESAVGMAIGGKRKGAVFGRYARRRDDCSCLRARAAASRRRAIVCVGILAILLAPLFGAGPWASVGASAPDGSDSARVVFVTSNDWHSRIVVAVADLPAGLLPEAADFPNAAWLAIGWGDHEYYPMRDPPTWLALKAGLWPTDAVIHLVPLTAPPRAADGFEVLEIELGATEHEALLVAIDATVARNGATRAPIAAPGLYRGSLFYPSHGRFHLLNTCNSWTARQLVAAGLPIRWRGVVTAEDLMRQLRALPGVRRADG